ncbi:hypothetical protein GHT09_008533 [Marmota monax]|uniref:G protein gamma domain-containing protein n=1 Tax=Marmota monax TaxID=9995 RepID=A0A834UKM1_MARMO|nr:hypothetical protein GHT09_008533 [Marmota monax]
MSSRASVSALQRLVEQLRLEASVERLQQSFSSTACRMPVRMLCGSEFQPQATPSESPDPAFYSEDLEEVC